MKNNSFVEIEVEKAIGSIITNLGISIVDIEYIQDGGYWYLRIYIEKLDQEVTIDDCALVSEKIDKIVDNLIEDKFILEVSSPGLERPLKKEKDFIRFLGEKAKIILKQKIKDKKNYTGILKEYKNKKLILLIGDDEIEIPYEKIKKANLIFEW